MRTDPRPIGVMLAGMGCPKVLIGRTPPVRMVAERGNPISPPAQTGGPYSRYCAARCGAALDGSSVVGTDPSTRTPGRAAELLKLDRPATVQLPG